MFCLDPFSIRLSLFDPSTELSEIFHTEPPQRYTFIQSLLTFSSVPPTALCRKLTSRWTKTEPWTSA